MTKEELFELKIKNIDSEKYDAAVRKWDSLSKPIDGFGDFEKAVAKIAAIQNTVEPSIDNRVLFVMCADNGIVEEGISQSESSVTKSVAINLGEGISSASTLGRECKADVVAVDIGIDCEDRISGVIDKKIARGTKNFLKTEAMSTDEVLKAIQTGMELVREYKEKGYKVILVGEMGIGNTTTSTALLCFLLNEDPDLVTGRGAGLDDEGLSRKKRVINEAIIKYSYLDELEPKERAFEALRAMGGLDIAALVGIFLGASLYELPVVNDGLITSVAALVAESINPKSIQYIISSHKGREGANSIALRKLQLKPMIDGDMALGEGTGALMMLKILDSMVYFFNNASTFGEVSIEAYRRNP